MFKKCCWKWIGPSTTTHLPISSRGWIHSRWGRRESKREIWRKTV